MARTEITAEPGVPLIEMTREFDAPRDLVFRAYTDPELLVQWLGPHRLTMRVEENDLRDGGRWRFVHRDEEGHEFGFHGVFHGDPSPDLTIRTFEWEGLPGHVSLETMVLEERDGRTVVRNVSAFPTLADRDGMVENGMEVGVREGDERLEALLEKLQDR